MTSRNRRIYDQQLLNVYINMYEQTINQIDLLYDDLTQIRESIDYLSGVRNRRGHRNESETAVPSRSSTASENIRSPTVQPTALPTGGESGLNQRNNILSPLFENVNNRRPVARGLLQTFGFGNFTGLGNFYDSVPVAPTQRQIELATRIVSFSSIENPPNTNCPITLDIFERGQNVTQILHCGHVFECLAFENWFRGHTVCPVCRYDIRDYVSSESYADRDAELETEVTLAVDVETNAVQHTDDLSENILNSTGGRNEEDEAERDRLQEMVDNLNLSIEDEELIQTFTNVTGNILNNLLNIPPGENPVTLDNSRYYLDASHNLVFESFMRNNFR